MNPPMRPTLHLIVIGAALVTLGLRPSVHVEGRSHAAAISHGRILVMPVTLRRPVLTADRALPALRAHKGHHRMPPRPASTAASTRIPDAATTTGPTGWHVLDRAVARIPNYRPGIVRWVISSRFGHWGTTDWYHATLYISPTVPRSYVYDVAVHEWSHELTVLDYDGDVAAATAATNRSFGGAGLVGEERAADCMAVLQGASWTHYTSCASAQWRESARRLLRGEQL